MSTKKKDLHSPFELRNVHNNFTHIQELLARRVAALTACAAAARGLSNLSVESSFLCILCMGHLALSAHVIHAKLPSLSQPPFTKLCLGALRHHTVKRAMTCNAIANGLDPARRLDY
eukprot:3239563-Pleurochrysis_carterae.AAC.1